VRLAGAATVDRHLGDVDGDAEVHPDAPSTISPPDKHSALGFRAWFRLLARDLANLLLEHLAQRQ